MWHSTRSQKFRKIFPPSVAFSFKLMPFNWNTALRIFIHILVLLYVAHQLIACRLTAKPSTVFPNISFMCIVLLVLWTLQHLVPKNDVFLYGLKISQERSWDVAYRVVKYFKHISTSDAYLSFALAWQELTPTTTMHLGCVPK